MKNELKANDNDENDNKGEKMPNVKLIMCYV